MVKYYVRYARIEGLSDVEDRYVNYGIDNDLYFFSDEHGDMDFQTEFTSEDITRMPASIQAAIGKGVLVLEEVE